MEKLDLDHVIYESYVKVTDDELCLLCNKELRMDYWNNDGGSWTCKDCNMNYYVIY